MFLICLILSISLIIIAKNIYHEFCPGKAFTYFWAGQIVLLLIGGYGYLLFKYTGILFILVCLIFFNIGALQASNGKRLVNIKRRGSCFVAFDEKKMMQILIILILLGFITPIQTIILHGFSLSNILDISTLLEMNNDLSNSRYSGDNVQGGLLGQIMGIFIGSCSLLGGFVFSISTIQKNKYICFSSLLPALFGALTQGAKMGIITSVFLFISGYITCCFIQNKSIIIKKATVIKGLIGMCAFFSVLLVSMMFRIGIFDIDTFFVVITKFISYAFGHLPAFDLWFDSQSLIPDSLTFGGKFFMGITNFLGILKREDGLYQKFYTISIDDDETNVFTIYRVFIDDFSIIGTPIFCMFLGYLSQKMYINCRKLKNWRVASSFLVAFYFMTFWSFVTSVFVYTTYIVMIFLFYLIISVTSRKVRIKTHVHI